MRPEREANQLREPFEVDPYVLRIYILRMDMYERLAAATGFQWDAGNQEKNWLSHQVSTGECEQYFFNQPLLVAPDEAHSHEEPRFFALGRTDQNRLLFVVFTFRGELIRVISARDMSKKERRVYSDHEEEHS
jgi:uncharacterized protein